ncbi:hypothetical protein [Pseudonocardia sp. WMMC193]|uniref:hypothetical protein n=1 Tax=Pseudonocardia sp. WMMC193 TaxID=2911965 RepID=UPI001F2EF963|nr:hypothetical protein [Pseudonocardia sp. WMMC193]MCF7552710.1 hypothetical protein [Pseudonocardia sp. WMMC193]
MARLVPIRTQRPQVAAKGDSGGGAGVVVRGGQRHTAVRRFVLSGVGMRLVQQQVRQNQ